MELDTTFSQEYLNPTIINLMSKRSIYDFRAGFAIEVGSSQNRLILFASAMGFFS